jgi:hypothetical protein
MLATASIIVSVAACSDDGSNIQRTYPSQSNGGSSSSGSSGGGSSSGGSTTSSSSGGSSGSPTMTGLPRPTGAADLTCAWLKSNANCWYAAYNAILSCAPPGVSDFGHFEDATKLKCTYTTTGSVVTFATAPATPLKPHDSVSAKTYAGDAGGTGTPCFELSVDWPATGPITTRFAPEGSNANAVEIRMLGQFGTIELSAMAIKCPDGSQVWTDNPQGLQNTCGMLPHVEYSGSTSTSVLLYSGVGPNDAGNAVRSAFTCIP